MSIYKGLSSTIITYRPLTPCWWHGYRCFPKTDAGGRGLCCANCVEPGLPFSQTNLSCGFRERSAERGVSVQDGGAELKFGDLAMEVVRHEALPGIVRLLTLLGLMHGAHRRSAKFHSLALRASGSLGPSSPMKASGCGQRFGVQITASIRRDCPAPADKWLLDEAVISIRGKKHWFWRAVYADGDVLEILVKSRRNAQAAKRFLLELMRRWGLPRGIVTVKLRSYGVAVRGL